MQPLQINAFHCQQDEWNTKEDTGKSLKNALHLRYAKRKIEAGFREGFRVIYFVGHTYFVPL